MPNSTLESLAEIIETDESDSSENLEGETGRRARKNYREGLPANRCAFCKQETDVTRKCGACDTENFRTCKKCVSLGAPKIHAPRRMLRVHTEKGSIYMCFPQCSRAAAYSCVQCNKWVDKTLVHAFTRQSGNTQSALCEPCSKARNLSVCASCHAVVNKHEEYKDAHGYKCDRCFSRGNSFNVVHKTFKIITSSASPQRTYGLELEINDVHKKGELAQEVGRLNIEGVEFSVVPDGSVHNGLEIVSLPAERRLLQKATKELCKTVRKYKHTYKSSGLHVHVQEKDLDIAKLFKLWCSVELGVFAFLPKFRRGGPGAFSYGGSIHDRGGMSIDRILNVRDFEDALDMQGSNRYMALNLLSISKHGTIELRCHHATSEYRDIFHYMTFIDTVWRRSRESWSKEDLTSLFHMSMASGTDKKAFEDMFNKLRVPLPTLHYLGERRDFYRANPGLTDRDIGIMSRYQIDNAEELSLAQRLTQEHQRMEANRVQRRRYMRMSTGVFTPVNSVISDEIIGEERTESEERERGPFWRMSHRRERNQRGEELQAVRRAVDDSQQRLIRARAMHDEGLIRVAESNMQNAIRTMERLRDQIENE